MRSGAHEGLMCPLEKGVRGIEISGLLPLTGFCGFHVLIEMKFRYERMIFRSYAQTKNFSGKVQWFYRTNEHIANTVKALVAY